MSPGGFFAGFTGVPIGQVVLWSHLAEDAPAELAAELRTFLAGAT